jgi:hypothetical protein
MYPFPESIQSSLRVLEFAEDEPPKSLKELNKRYHRLALKYHPDKAGAEAVERFKEINDAHKRVKSFFYPEDGIPDIDTGYDSILQLFIQSILVKMSGVGGSSGGSSGESRDAIQSLIAMIITKGIQSGIAVFRNMDKHTCITIYELLAKNQDIFGISREMMDELTQIVEEKTGNDLVVRLNPSLLDMLLDRVYILHEEGQTFYIPLWHSELHFTRTGTGTGTDTGETSDVIVLCEPELPDNVTMDEHNNIYISLEVDICELFARQVLPVYINDEIKARGFVYYLHACDLTLRSDTRQCVILRGVTGCVSGSDGGCGGIARCNTHTHSTTDMYKVDIRANVYANVRLMML